MLNKTLLFYLISLLWLIFGASILGFMFYFIWIKVLIPGREWGYINLGILVVVMLPLSCLISILPKFFAKFLSLELRPNSLSKVVAMVGAVIVFISYMIGGSLLYFSTYPSESWLLEALSHDPSALGPDFSIWWFGIGLVLSGIAGTFLWKNFNIRIL
jgi:hypothetical protein